MEKKGYIVGIKILGFIMFFYSISMLILFLPLLLTFIFSMFKMKYYDFTILFYFFGLLLIGFFYLLSSLGILRLKKWGRIISIYNSGFAIIFSVYAWLRFKTTMAISPYANSLSRISLLIISLFLIVPALFILLSMLSSKAKDRFKEDIIQESKGVTIFVFLFILGNLLELVASFKSPFSLYRIPQPYITIWFWVIRTDSILGLFTVVGLLFRKDVFRKIAIALVLFDLISLIIELPFVNIAELFSQHSPITVAFLVLLNVLYALGFIYFFTRSKVREQFKEEKGLI